MVAIGNPRRILPFIPPGSYGYLDITRQVSEAYGASVVKRDLCLVAGEDVPLVWAGGELLVGPRQFFADLSAVAEQSFDRYLAAIETVHHQGDEMVVASALRLLSHRWSAVDAGALSFASRHWSVATRHRQVPGRLALKSDFLHLPADKHFLARYEKANPGEFDPERFLAAYRRSYVMKGPRRVAVGLLGRVRHMAGSVCG
jgi:hypothetical protein